MTNANRIRVVVLGSPRVGKSAITVRYLTKRYIGEYSSTSDFLYRHNITFDNVTTEVEILDTSKCAHEIVARQGFPFESYEIATADGYILGLFRIPHNNKDVGGKRQPVYLHHGLGLCSHVWFDHGPRSLAYALSNEGYDVWMSNTRGTRYSQKHITYTTKNPQFWNFSFTEIGLYDLSANSKFINKMTGQKVIYIGHSQGTVSSYVYSIEKPKEAHELIKGIVSLAPVAYLTHPRTILQAFVPFEDKIVDVAKRLGIYSLGVNPLLRKTLSKICNIYPLNEICVLVLFLSLGFDYEELLPKEGCLYEHIRWGEAFVIVYSVSDRNSFHEAQEMLNQLSKLKLPSYYTTLLLGNKRDLDHCRQICVDEGQELSLQYNSQFYEVSAAENFAGVSLAIQSLLREARSVQLLKALPIRRKLGVNSVSKVLGNIFGKNSREERKKRPSLSI